jgi:hypothetical protein
MNNVGPDEPVLAGSAVADGKLSGQATTTDLARSRPFQSPPIAGAGGGAKNAAHSCVSLLPVKGTGGV